MNMIDEIREKFLSGQYEYSKHAVDQSIIRHITTAEIREAVLLKSELNTDRKETMINQLVTYTLEYKGKLYVIENVPARVCLESGEQFFSPETVEKLQATIWEQKKPKRVIETPVFEYA